MPGRTSWRHAALLAALAAAAPGCGRSQAEVRRDLALQQRDALDLQLTAERHRHQRAQEDWASQERMLRGQLDQVSRDSTACDHENQRLADTLRQHRRIAERRSALFDRFASELADLVTADQVVVTLRDQHLGVAIRDEALFRGESRVPSAEGKVILSRIAAVLRDLPGRPIRIATHVAPAPRPGWSLANARAQAILAELARRGIDREMLSTGTRPETLPAAYPVPPARATELVIEPTPDDVPPELRAFRESRG